MKQEVQIRIIVEGPPPGVHWAIQKGRDQLWQPVISGKDDLVFEFSLTVSDPEEPRFVGPFAQGSPAVRFVYVTAGRRAGGQGFWDRRAKVPLKGITPDMVARALQEGGVLEARIKGRSRDGGPACASVPVLGGWSLAMPSQPASDALCLIPATRAHVDLVCTWPDTAEACARWSGGSVTWPIDRDRVDKELSLGASDNQVLVRGDLVLAFGQIRERSPRRAHLSRLIVRPDARGQGLGRELVARLLERARAEGYTYSTLNVDPTNEPAMRAYQGLGFEEAERPASDPKRGPDSVFMRRGLEG